MKYIHIFWWRPTEQISLLWGQFRLVQLSLLSHPLLCTADRPSQLYTACQCLWLMAKKGQANIYHKNIAILVRGKHNTQQTQSFTEILPQHSIKVLEKFNIIMMSDQHSQSITHNHSYRGIMNTHFSRDCSLTNCWSKFWRSFSRVAVCADFKFVSSFSISPWTCCRTFLSSQIIVLKSFVPMTEQRAVKTSRVKDKNWTFEVKTKGQGLDPQSQGNGQDLQDQGLGSEAICKCLG